MKKGSSCECCGSTEKLTKDHKIPKSKGGSNEPENIGTLCVYCNSIKGDKIMDYEQLRNYIDLLTRQKKERTKIIVQIPWRKAPFIPRPMTGPTPPRKRNSIG